MLMLQVENQTLEKELTELLQHQFDGNTDKMLQALINAYTTHLKRLKYSGILKWQTDGLAFQKELRNEWK